MFRYRFFAALAIGSFVGLPVAGAAHATTIDAPSVPRDVLYVSDYANDDVLAFDASPRAKNRQPLLTIPVGAHPNGLWVDRHGVLYVAAYESVLEFKPGATAPFRTITAGVTGAVAVTVDTGGTLYVVNHSGPERHGRRVFRRAVGGRPRRSRSPSRTRCSDSPAASRSTRPAISTSRRRSIAGERPRLPVRARTDDRNGSRGSRRSAAKTALP